MDISSLDFKLSGNSFAIGLPINLTDFKHSISDSDFGSFAIWLDAISSVRRLENIFQRIRRNFNFLRSPMLPGRSTIRLLFKYTSSNILLASQISSGIPSSWLLLAYVGVLSILYTIERI
jgi:hypothetical protein